MSETVRAFVALRVPFSPALGDVLAELAGFGRPVKPVAAENLHLTLKFLGETDASWISDIEELLDDVAAEHTAFEITLHGLGAFPKPSRPSVIWTAMSPAEPVVTLAGAIEAGLAAFGFSPETRVFRPHVTLARIKSRPPRDLAEILRRHQSTQFATFTINEITLVRSELSPQGPRYTPIHTAPLDPN